MNRPTYSAMDEVAYFTEGRGWVALATVAKSLECFTDLDFRHNMGFYASMDSMWSAKWSMSFELQPRSLSFGHIADWRGLFWGLPIQVDCLKRIIDWDSHVGVPSDGGVRLTYPEYMLMKKIVDDQGHKLYLNDRDFNMLFISPRAKLHFKVG